MYACVPAALTISGAGDRGLQRLHVRSAHRALETHDDEMGGIAFGLGGERIAGDDLRPFAGGSHEKIGLQFEFLGGLGF